MAVLSDIIIHSTDAARMGRFLAELLELDIEEKGGRILLKGPGLGLAVEATAEGERTPPNLGLEFSAENEEELLALWQRYVFVMYRLQGEKHGPHAPLTRRTQDGEEEVTLLLKDPDGRTWPFTASRALQ